MQRYIIEQLKAELVQKNAHKLTNLFNSKLPGHGFCLYAVFMAVLEHSSLLQHAALQNYPLCFEITVNIMYCTTCTVFMTCGGM